MIKGCSTCFVKQKLRKMYGLVFCMTLKWLHLHVSSELQTMHAYAELNKYRPITSDKAIFLMNI